MRRNQPRTSARGVEQPTADRPRTDGDGFPIDLEDHGEEFVVSANLPGLRTQDIDVSVRNARVRIAADFGQGDEDRYLRQERGRGEVSRVLHLPEPVDERRVSANYTGGVLRVHLPRRHRPKRVEVE
ncbi:Hsp20/alpha crystallin family protein [Haloarchaeobius litoreus]|uniref:Hsp20/alpha crystallin family protein n=1 Tax=Haloarchaeobius litoreus TaxID=755306 RepID=A0ABD6DR92_9EURY|nr:Hsp20/alpha crystallin family protein [Haloarchaeobius litoreus]